MLRAAQSIIGRTRIGVGVGVGIGAGIGVNQLSLISAKTRAYSMVAGAKVPVIQPVNGKIPLSVFEKDHFLDYDKYERNLKIVRDR